MQWNFPSMKVAGVLLSLGVVAGCSDGKPISGLSRSVESNEIQENRFDIVMSFTADEVDASVRYKAEWDGLQGTNEPTRRIDIARKLTIAGQLLATDPQNYSSYYAYVISHMPADDWELRGIALSGLAKAEGAESISLLFKELDGFDSLMIAEAVTAIDYRLKTAIDNPALQGDVSDIKRRSVEICRANPRNRHIVEYCDEHHMNRQASQ